MRRAFALLVLVLTAVWTMGSPALACGGLVAPNGTVNLLKTTTMAGYFEGVEHYVTSFEFVGGGAKFGSIVPLPGIPSKVRKAGRWTLQRLVQEVQPPLETALLSADAAGAESASKVQVVLETSIDALDITIVKGGGDAVGRWAKDQGFSLSPDAPEVLDFYAERSPVFMAVRFDAKRAAAREQTRGDGTPVHLVIPTQSPWVPLRILGLGKQANEPIEADVFLFTPNQPRMLPVPVSKNANSGLILERSEPASDLLLSDIRSDRGMRWLPGQDMWFSYLRIDTTAGQLTHDLAIDPTGVGAPSPVAAGLIPPITPKDTDLPVWPWIVAGILGLMTIAVVDRTLDPAWKRPRDNDSPWQTF